VPEPKTADIALPRGSGVDVVDLLLTQHARIEEQFLLVIGATGAAKRDAFDDLVRLLAVHETAEEEVVHPVSRGLVDGGDALIDDRLDEERQAKEMLNQLLEAGVHDKGFDTGLLLLRNAVLTHARYEERYEFSPLRAKVPAERLRAMATAVRAAEAVAPTRPHAGAESAKANLALGPPMAVIDRVRDLIREATNRPTPER
jgi:hemerythrin HHE cation binding domain-containing protein